MPIISKPDNPISSFLDPDQAQPDEGLFHTVLRKAAGLAGVNDPTSVMQVGGPMATPLISLYKDAAGIPSAALRSEGTKAFLESALGHLGPLQDAAEVFAQRYPRVAAHMRLSNEIAPGHGVSDLSNSGGYQARTRIADILRNRQPARIEFSDHGLAKIAEDPRYAANDIWHEGTHVAQALGNRDMDALYSAAHNLTGYNHNPFEISARRAGWKAAGIVNDSTTRKFPGVTKLLKLMGEYGGSQSAEAIDNTMKMRAGTMSRARDILRMLYEETR